MYVLPHHIAVATWGVTAQLRHSGWWALHACWQGWAHPQRYCTVRKPLKSVDHQFGQLPVVFSPGSQRLSGSIQTLPVWDWILDLIRFLRYINLKSFILVLYWSLSFVLFCNCWCLYLWTCYVYAIWLKLTYSALYCLRVVGVKDAETKKVK